MMAGRGAHRFQPLQHGSADWAWCLSSGPPSIQAIEGDLKTAALRGLLAYGAVILWFLGGIHWGAAMTRSISQTDSGSIPAGSASCRSLARRWTSLLIMPDMALPYWRPASPRTGCWISGPRVKVWPRLGIQASPTAHHDRRRRPHRRGVRPVKGLRSPELTIFAMMRV